MGNDTEMETIVESHFWKIHLEILERIHEVIADLGPILEINKDTWSEKELLSQTAKMKCTLKEHTAHFQMSCLMEKNGMIPVWEGTRIFNENEYVSETLRRALRSLRYACAKMDCFPLPPFRATAYLSSTHGVYRSAMVARVIWLLDRKQNNQSVFPRTGGLRFLAGPWEDNPDKQLELLPEKYHWMVHKPDEPCTDWSLEWVAISKFVGQMTYGERNWLWHHWATLVNTGVIEREDLSIEMCTTPATAEALAAQCSECPICMNQMCLAVGEGFEGAVKTRCGHFLGKSCLRNWLHGDQLNSKTCPMCRTVLFDSDLFLQGHSQTGLTDWTELFPQHMLPLVREFVAAFRARPALERMVDKMLLDATELDKTRCYSGEMQTFLEELHDHTLMLADLDRSLRILIDDELGAAIPGREHMGDFDFTEENYDSAEDDSAEEDEHIEE